MALAILSGTAVAGSASGTGSDAATLTYTNSAACVMVMKFTTIGVGGYIPITSVTDSAGVTWHRRRQVQFQSLFTGNSSVAYFNQEIWWANVTAIHGSAVTITVNREAGAAAVLEGVSPKYAIFGVTGSAVPSTPWDVNTNASQSAQYGNNSGTATTVTTPYAATSASAMILAFMDQITASGGTASSLGSGNTQIALNTTGSTFKTTTAAEFLLGTGTGSMAWTTTNVSWVNTTDALTSDSNGTATDATPARGTISLTSSIAGGVAGSGTLSAILPSANAGDILIAFVGVGVTSGTSPAQVTGLSGATAQGGGSVSWFRLLSEVSTNNGSSQELWATLTPVAAGTNITISAVGFTGATRDAASIVVMAFSGLDTSQIAASPLGDEMPAHGAFSTTTTQPSVTGLFAAAPSSVIVGAASGTGGAMGAAGTGFTDVASISQAGTTNHSSIRAEMITPGVGAKTVSFAGTYLDWSATGLVLRAAPASLGNTGTIATNLTEVSQAVTAKETFTGTATTSLTKASNAALAAELRFIGMIATHLTKLSQSLVAAERFTGTVATHLTKPSQSLAGKEVFTGTVNTALSKVSMGALSATEAFTGAITTNLTKVSMSLAATEVFTGTMTTALSKVSGTVTAAMEAFGTITTGLSKANLTVNAKETFTGSIMTVLSGVSQDLRQQSVQANITTTLQALRQTIHASEIFTGAIVTDIGGASHIALGTSVNAREVFTGTIVTRLNQANFAAAAEERFIGHIATHLGSASGSMVANVVQALEIIEGPIVTTLPPFRPLLLGVQLGSPGEAKWFSWRYTDE